MTRLGTARSKLLARTLAGSWRETLPPPNLSEAELSSITQPLLWSGGASLAWRRLIPSPLRDYLTAQPLQQAYRQSTLRAAVHELHIATLFTLFRSHGIEPVLVKGWSTARLYPEQGLRPYGDTDLCVPPHRYAEAQALLQDLKWEGFWVDLHSGFATLDDASFDNLYSRTRLVPVGHTEARILSPEDQLRVMCVHFLRHGGFRPLWLCDVAVAVETRPADFNWERCLGSKMTTNWVNSVIALAHTLLGAHIEGTPALPYARRLPKWFVAAVLKAWEDPRPANQPPQSYVRPMSSYLRHPAGLLAALRKRWPHPITASVEMKAAINNTPRFPLQLAASIRRASIFIRSIRNAER